MLYLSSKKLSKQNAEAVAGTFILPSKLRPSWQSPAPRQFAPGTPRSRRPRGRTQHKIYSATKTMGDSNFPNRPALGQLNLINRPALGDLEMGVR